MQGVVTDEKGTKVKAAIVVLLKVKEPEDVTEAETATYIETDEEGRFIIQDINPDDKYFIEIHVERSEDGLQDREIETKEDPKKEEPKKEEPELKPEDPYEPEDSKGLEDPEDKEKEETEDPEEAGPDDEMGAPIEEKYIVDSLMWNQQIDETTSSNISVNNLYFTTDVELKDKLYFYRNNFW